MLVTEKEAMESIGWGGLTCYISRFLTPPHLRLLDAGERAAIALAMTMQPAPILIDDRAGVAAARTRGLEVIGTLGLLERAARFGLIDLRNALATLQATNFHARPVLYERLLARDRAWRGGA